MMHNLQATQTAKWELARVEGRRRDPGEPGVLPVNGFSIPPQRLLGAYYTPDKIAAVLAEWAILNPNGNVLDPSFGGCSFMQASASILKRLGCLDPGRLVYGVDVDASCNRYVRKHSDLIENNVVFRDFLALRPRDLPGAPFHAIVGNPPYVRHHWMKGDAKVNARSTLELAQARVPATASSWAYFVVHALQFLADGGRLALVLPEAVLQADYAKSVRTLLAQRFERTQLIQLRERVFADTEEPVVIVLGEGRGPGELEVKSVADVSELARVIEGAETPRHLITTSNGRTLERAAFEVLSTAIMTKCIRHFGQLAQIRIGFVTGANRYFIRSASDLDELGHPDEARLPVVTRTSWLDGLTFSADDHAVRAAADSRAFLVHPMDDTSALSGWLAQGEAEAVNTRHKCGDRDPWYQVRLVDRPPDAFASSTRQGLPRLAVNIASYHCSNTLHMVHWADDLKVDVRSILVAYHTSLSGLWAELNGRRYGGGVLKLDPGVLKRMPIPMVDDAAGAFEEMDRLLRAGDEGKARDLADQVVLAGGLGLSARSISTLRQACASLANQRIPRRGGRDG